VSFIFKQPTVKLYDQKHIRNFYDQYGDSESRRWEKSIVEKVKYCVHLHYLQRYIKPSSLVLELGAGTGMFTKEVIGCTNRLVVTDLSPVQLKLNQERAHREGYFQQIQDWKIVDICDLSEFDDNSFDTIICYGGPLSYVFEHNRKALSEMHRVLKPGGIGLISVMNLWGTVNQSLITILNSFHPDDNEKIIATGNLHPSSFNDSDHHCHMYRSREFIELLEQSGFEILQTSASNCLSTQRATELMELENDQQKWNYFLDLEIRACRSEGMIESGSHLIAIVSAAE